MLKKTDVATAITKLKEGHKVVSVIDKEKYPLCPYPYRYEYNPSTDYVLTRGHIKNADWFYEV